MALTRKMLKAMGIEDEKVDQIIEAHTEVTDALKSERDKFREDAEKLKETQQELENLKAESDKMDKDPFKVKYDALKEEFQKFKDDIAAKETTEAKQSAYRNLLKEVGVSEKRLDAVLRVTDLESVEIDKDGKLKNADKLKTTVAEEWSDFITKDGRQGADPAKPPENQHVDYDSMSDAEYYKATYEAAKNK